MGLGGENPVELLVQIAGSMFKIAKEEGNAGYIAAEIMKGGPAAVAFVALCTKEGWVEPLKTVKSKGMLLGAEYSKEILVSVEQALFVKRSENSFLKPFFKKKNTESQVQDKTSGKPIEGKTKNIR